MSSPLTSAPHTDARSPRTARSKNWMIFRKYPTYRLPSAYRLFIDGTACLPSAQKPSRRTPLKSSQFLPKIFAKTKNLPSTFPVGTSGYCETKLFPTFGRNAHHTVERDVVAVFGFELVRALGGGEN
eukprot:scaffold10882_cov108-Isochrysis_galbana.AAC.2